jgi:Fur family transcriptional regulator, peroxide stress response regulator
MESTDIKDILSNKGIKPSFHRMKVLEYLVKNRNHPTVDVIFKDISPEIPTLSKTTIYNTLKTLQSSGLVQSVTIEDNEVKYDADVNKHAHFKCTECGHLYDIPMDTKVLQIKSIGGHLVKESQLNFKGVCKSCQKSK